MWVDSVQKIIGQTFTTPSWVYVHVFCNLCIEKSKNNNSHKYVMMEKYFFGIYIYIYIDALRRKNKNSIPIENIWSQGKLGNL